MSKQKNPGSRRIRKSSAQEAAAKPETTVMEPVAASLEPVTADVVEQPVSEMDAAPSPEPVIQPCVMDAEITVQVGFAAGKVWQALQRGALNLTELQEQLEESETIILMAIGWLARENKLVIAKRDRTYEMGLRVNNTHRA
ncbi:MAG: winged helix-turn-helix domain-containing protein [Acidobacteria bacterium]|nr:winged helix-turn-helix domain-containing protein [Acidobacteriota bacterium]MBI3658693.1 winged helix-turn-helix domain-containing protein [Acidobacteriota bacterium]